jgi:hypothetical protein
MKRYQKENLRRMQELYDFIAAHPDCTMVSLCAHFEQPASTIRAPLHHLRDGFYIESAEGKRYLSGQQPSTYTVTDKGRPTEPPERRTIATNPNAIRRKIAPAKQVGMVPYGDLPRDFFGRVA